MSKSGNTAVKLSRNRYTLYVLVIGLKFNTVYNKPCMKKSVFAYYISISNCISGWGIPLVVAVILARC